ncbi:hypothetical protein, partial [Brucella oryzae]|uniref:hypothetical protein n=1 Tax=Brucella oryzae TaxID=335286 RepID=UPI001ABF3A6F
PVGHSTARTTPKATFDGATILSTRTLSLCALSSWPPAAKDGRIPRRRSNHTLAHTAWKAFMFLCGIFARSLQDKE